MLDFSELNFLRNLKSLYLNLFDLRDYHFVEQLPESLEEFSIYADTMDGEIQFDCKWLLKFKNLERLYLGNKAKKNMKAIASLPKLKHLTLRGIKLESFDFLKENNLESLAVLWCGMNDLSSLTGWESLKSLELWRIMKLENLSFLSSLTGLEVLKLKDLKHIHTLPDLSALTNLKQIVLDNMRIEDGTISEELRKIVQQY